MKRLLTMAVATGFTLAAGFGSAWADTQVESSVAASAQLQKILAAQSEEQQARYGYRHPQQTLEFFAIKPGMTVVEAMPGGGWYSKILAPYLGPEGKLIGVNYPDNIWPNFSWAKPEYIQGKIDSTAQFPAQVAEWAPNNTPAVESYTFATIPEALSESVDAVLYIRALHNLSAFNEQGQFMDKALQETYRILKPGGVVGVVQHSSDVKGLIGSTGYLNKDALVAAMAEAGLTLVKESALNNNAKDQPKADEIVWRLPPSYATSSGDAKLKQSYADIGESNRMTLLFKKL